MARVRPGVEDTLAALSPNSPLIKLDLPVFERPRKANSGAVVAGNCSGEVAESRRKYWRKLIAEQQASGQKALAFCREHGISQYSFYRWRQRLRQGAVPQFAELEVTQAATASPESTLELILRNGERLRIGDDAPAQ